MSRLRISSRLLLGQFVFLPLILLIGLACSTSEPTPTPTVSKQGIGQATDTASYKISLEIGPVVSMLTSDEGMQVMGAMTGMTFLDQGQAVDHHLEVHVFDKSSGARMTDITPTVTITDQATGTSRQFSANVHPSGEVPFVLACMTSKHRETERHFGDNLYLLDGKYTITIGIGNETSVHENIVVSSG